MTDKIIEGEVIQFNNPTQIINMGGPWIGELQIADRIRIDNVIVDNIYFEPISQKLYFPRYHLVSKWQKDNFFCVYSLHWKTGRLCVYDIKFDLIYIESVSVDEELTYFCAFHDKNPTDKRTIQMKGRGHAVEVL